MSQTSEEEDESEDGEVQEEDEGHPVAELFVAGLVAEEVHGEEGSWGATEKGKEDESGFGDAPTFMASLVFVEAVKEEGQEVDCEEVI